MVPSARCRRRAKVGVEPLEGRALLSYLVVIHDHRAIPVHTGDARVNEPLYSNGLAVKHEAHFYPYYTGPKRPDLNGLAAQGYVSGKNLVLSATVAGPIVTRPTAGTQESFYTFAIDRGRSGNAGPYPGRPWIRFDSVVVVKFLTRGLTAYVQANDPMTNQPGTTPKALPASDVVVAGSVLTVTVPLSLLPSSGHAYNQWNANFFTRNPDQKNDFHSVASFTPEYTEFQIYAVPTT